MIRDPMKEIRIIQAHPRYRGQKWKTAGRASYCYRLYESGLTYREIGKIIGVTGERVLQLVNKYERRAKDPVANKVPQPMGDKSWMAAHEAVYNDRFPPLEFGLELV